MLPNTFVNSQFRQFFVILMYIYDSEELTVHYKVKQNLSIQYFDKATTDYGHVRRSFQAELI